MKRITLFLFATVLTWLLVTEPTAAQQPIHVYVPVRTSGLMPIDRDVGDRVKQLLQHHVPSTDVVIHTGNLSPVQLADALKAGQYDVTITTVGVEHLAQQGLVLALDDFINRSNFHIELFDSMRINGRLFDLPIFLDPFVVLYNRDLFDQNDVPYPSADWSWEQLIEAARATYNPDIPVSPVANGMLQERLWPMVARQSGHKLTAIDDRTYSYSLDIAYRLLSDALIPEDSFIVTRSFYLGHIPWQITTLDPALALLSSNMRWGIAPLPDLPGSTGVNQLSGFTTVAIAANTSAPESAWNVAHVLAKEGTSELALFDTGNLPSAYFTADEMETWIKTVLPPEEQYGSLAEELRTLLSRPSIYVGRGFAEANNALARTLQDEMAALLDGATNQEQVLDTVRAQQNLWRNQ